MLAALWWYLLVTVLGLLTFPLAYRLLPALAERGYAFSRALGLLLWGYTFWLLSSLGLLANDPGGIFFALLVLIGLSAWSLSAIGWDSLRAWLGEHKRAILTTEVLFALAFAAWTLVRATAPEVLGTEKPMELAFINASMNSAAMPSFDPWLSGFAISYYYFGYVMVAMLAQLSGVSAGVAFNLGVALVFALVAVGAWGLVYNLLALWRPARKGNIFSALLGPFFVMIVSNATGLLEILHGQGLFWREGPDGQLTSAFWTWLDMKDLNQPPVVIQQQLVPRNFGSGGWWWWRASRVINDVSFNGAELELIDEFPFFSFLLGDLHPHVLAMPFAFLAMALTLNLFLGGARNQGERLFGRFALSPLAFALAALTFGGLAFLNIWDFPIYVGVFAGAYVLLLARQQGWRWSLLGDFLLLGLALGIAGYLLYLPYHLSFSSQASGILPNMLNPSRGVQLWVMFGVLFVLIFAYLLYLWRRGGDSSRLWRGLLIALAVTLALWLLSLLLLVIILYVLPLLGNLVAEAATVDVVYLSEFGAPSAGDLLAESLRRRLSGAGGWLTLVLLLGSIIGLLLPARDKDDPPKDRPPLALPDGHAFALLLLLMGGLLVLAPEFIYLRDYFGTRMNTVFKFFIQAWLLWGVVAAYAVTVMLEELRFSLWGVLYRLALGLAVLVGLVYPLYGLWDRSSGFSPTNGYSLDGAETSPYFSFADRPALEFLRQQEWGVVAEAVGGSYTGAARVATYTGMPTVLGWEFHEIQWGRDGGLVSGRSADIETLYTTSNWDQAKELIERYDIRYIYVGPQERSSYRVNEIKFQRYLPTIFQEGEVTIYAVP